MVSVRHHRSSENPTHAATPASTTAMSALSESLIHSGADVTSADFYPVHVHSPHEASNVDSNLLRKMIASHTSVTLHHDDYERNNNGFLVEEVIVYFLIILLLAFFFIYMVRCVRTTLDPYNTVARVAWLETLEKRDSKIFPSLYRGGTIN